MTWLTMPGKAEALAVLRAEDRHPGGTQALDLLGDDDAAATTDDDLHVAGAGLGEAADEVLKKYSTCPPW